MHTFKFLLLSFLSVVILGAANLKAFEYQVEGGGVEDGDDRLHKVYGIRFGQSKEWGIGISHAQENFSVVQQEQSFVRFYGQKVLDIWLSPIVLYGLGVFQESTKIVYPDPADAAANQDETSIYGGPLIGVQFQFPVSANIAFTATMESIIVPAGIDGAIFLAVGRWNALTLGLSVNI